MPSYRFSKPSTAPPPGLRLPLANASLQAGGNQSLAAGSIASKIVTAEAYSLKRSSTSNSLNLPQKFTGMTGFPADGGLSNAQIRWYANATLKLVFLDSNPGVDVTDYFYAQAAATDLGKGANKWQNLWMNGDIQTVNNITFGDATVQSTAAVAYSGPTVSAKYKAADETVSSSTLQDDDDLKLTVTASSIWAFELWAPIGDLASTTGTKWAWTAPAASTGYYNWEQMDVSGTLASNYQTDLTTQVTRNPAATKTSLKLKGVYIGGANAGTLQFQWATNGGAGNLTLFKGSYAIFTRLV